MALGLGGNKDNKPAPDLRTAAEQRMATTPATTPTPAKVENVTTPAPAKAAPAPTTAPATTPAPAFTFEDAVVPGRGQTDTAPNPEYVALKSKVQEHWNGVQSGAIKGHDGVAFNSSDVARHTRYIRQAAQELGCGVSIKLTNESNGGKSARILFRTKTRKVYADK